MSEPMPIHSPRDVADLLGVSTRQARNICNTVFRSKPSQKHRRLTDEELEAIRKWHEKYGRKPSNKNFVSV